MSQGTQQPQKVRRAGRGRPRVPVRAQHALVRYAARHFSACREPTVAMLQVGTIGLIKAIDRYDVSRGVEFTTLAVSYTQGAITDEAEVAEGIVASNG
ncbi:sigma factor [Streptomyces sp. G7(2002)]|uniref:sigma factor n=1 Tax=Streptomyces sp. G7(2002) TaxID=2971798 RepID=UPI0031592350